MAAPEEVLLAAAFCAGVAEGGSILWKANNENKYKSSQIPAPLLLVPSILYGTVALPMSIVGASPGFAVLSSLPFCPPISRMPPLSQEDEISRNSKNRLYETQSIRDTAEVATAATAVDREQTPTAITLLAREEEILSLSQQEPPMNKRSEWIQKSREQNRQALVAARHPKSSAPPEILQANNTSLSSIPSAAKYPSAASGSSTSWMHRCFAALDGRPLQTPLAEGLRRTRMLLIGAGFATFIFSYQQQLRNEEEERRATKAQLQQIGRDSNAIYEFVAGHKKDGVAIRLQRHAPLKRTPSCYGASSHNNIVPFVLSSANVENKSSLSVHKGKSVGHVRTGGSELPLYWNVGRTSHDWKQIPVTADWLVCPNNEFANNKSKSIISPKLVVEADVSLPLSRCFKPHGVDENVYLESARFHSRLIHMIAHQKGIVTNETKAKQQGTASLVNVFIGSGNRNPISPLANEIHIDGLTATSFEVISWAEQKHSRLTQQASLVSLEKEENLAEAEEVVSNRNPALALVSFIDFVGERIRHAGIMVFSALMFAPTKSIPKVLHVFTDEQNVSQWLKGPAYAKGWSVVRHDVVSRGDSPADLYNKAMVGGGIAVVCCGSDEKTCNFVCSVISSSRGLENSTKLLVLVEKSSSESTVKSLASEFQQNMMSISTVSTDEIHERLLGKVRGMLKEGKEPLEVQELVARF